jgi:PAS domain S-box-containing protein
VASPSPADQELVGFVTVREAARFLGVPDWKVRSWDRTGILRAERHSDTGERVFRSEDLSPMLGVLRDEPQAADDRWVEVAESDHFVQFYDDDEFLVDSVTGFIAEAVRTGGAGLVIATPKHRDGIEKALADRGIDVAKAVARERFVALDAAETLSKFMAGREPDPRRFSDVVGGLVDRMPRGRRLRAFGEMVALLWAEGNRAGAVHLEELWNDLGKARTFALFCAYPLDGFGDEAQAGAFAEICSCHARVMPSERYAALPTADDRLRAIARLQQKAAALEAEVARRKVAEAALSRRERELRDFFENAVEGLHRVGPDGTILWANPAELDLLGYEPHEYVGRPITEFHVDADVIEDMLTRLRRGETVYNHPARLRCKDGSIKHVRVTSNALFEDGRFAYTRCFTRDVTDLVRADEELREGDRRKDEFLATLAHELRNPLAPIRNALQVLRMTGVGERVREMMERQVDHLVRLVDDLLEVSRITRGCIELRTERVDLARVVQTAVETSRPLIEAAGHRITVALPDGPLVLVADPVRLAQVVANLLNNAARYTEPGGRIDLSVEARAGEAVVRVRDSGIGIPPEMIPRIFEMFTQVSRSDRRSQGGLGIGLALVQTMVRMHGGTVEADSPGPGRGSVFTVRLPLAEGPAPGGAAAPPDGDRQWAAHPLRLLVVDDNRDAADSLAMLLKIAGSEVEVARDGPAALEAARRWRPDVAFLDLGMPGMDGYEVARRLRADPSLAGTVLIAVSGWGQEGDRRRSREAGIDHHLIKPVEFKAIQALLASLKPCRPAEA